MSEYEVVDLFNSHAETLLTILMGFISATSAFLIVAYLVAKELSAFLASVAMALYSIASLVLMALAERQGTALVDLRGQMRQILSWHPGTYEDQWIMPTAFFLLSF